jgi:hypothetical protein
MPFCKGEFFFGVGAGFGGCDGVSGVGFFGCGGEGGVCLGGCHFVDDDLTYLF